MYTERFFFSSFFSLCLSEATAYSRGATSTFYNLTAFTSIFPPEWENLVEPDNAAPWFYQADHPRAGSGCLNGDSEPSSKTAPLPELVNFWLINGEFWRYVPLGMFDIGASGQNTSEQCEYFSLLMMNRSGLEQSVVRTGLLPVLS